LNFDKTVKANYRRSADEVVKRAQIEPITKSSFIAKKIEPVTSSRTLAFQRFSIGTATQSTQTHGKPSAGMKSGDI
jgi:hypothetical protein